MIEERAGRALAERDLQAAGEKEKAAIPEDEDHRQPREIRAEPLPPEKPRETQSSPEKRTNATPANNPPTRVPDLFHFG
jgi:hypothetical protein